MWTRRKRLRLACSTFNSDRLTADRLPNRSMLPSVAVQADNGGRSRVSSLRTSLGRTAIGAHEGDAIAAQERDAKTGHGKMCGGRNGVSL